MPKARLPNPKLDTLRRQGGLNPRPHAVRDAVFTSSDFFDALDLVQVKYEMLRRVRIDGEAISRSATAFGFSRPSFYQAQAAFARGGLPALVQKKRGPRQAHKLGKAVVDFLRQCLSADPSLRAAQLVHRVQDQFGIQVHSRSVERALARDEKKRPSPTASKKSKANPAPRRTKNSAGKC